MTATFTPEEPGSVQPEPIESQARLDRSDRLYISLLFGGGIMVLLLTVAIALFLGLRASQVLSVTGLSFFFHNSGVLWDPAAHKFDMPTVLLGTVEIALVGMVFAFPLSLGSSLFISEIAQGRLKRIMIFVIDLLAAVPSVVYGIWGADFLQGHVAGLARWMAAWLGWIPIFNVPGNKAHDPNVYNSVFTASTFIAGMVVAIMMIPIQCSIMREAFSQAPLGEREGAYALGATKWGMIRTVVMPFGRGGIIGGSILGLGRALGETIAVLLIISPVWIPNIHILSNGSVHDSGANSVAFLIATYFGEYGNTGIGISSLMAAGLTLFVITMGVNFAASTIIARSRSGAMSEA